MRELVLRSRRGVGYILGWAEQEDGMAERVLVHENFRINGINYAESLGHFDQLEVDFHGPLRPCPHHTATKL